MKKHLRVVSAFSEASVHLIVAKQFDVTQGTTNTKKLVNTTKA